VTTTEFYDFKGNAVKAARCFTEHVGEAPDWAGDVALEAERFESATAYDALNRAVALTAPDGSVVRPRFNDASLLEGVDVNIRGACEQGRPVWSPFVRHINYDAKGQRQVIRYANGAVTEYEYERTTFRMRRLRTTRAIERTGLAAGIFKDPGTVQDLHYTHDPIGNITRIADAAMDSAFHDNHRIDAEADYTYDPLYRLLRATGREHAAQSAFSFAPADGDYRDFPFVGSARLHDLQALRCYTEHYDYAPVGNILRLRHDATGGNFEREYAYESPSLLEPWRDNNRLSHTSVRHGSMTLTERYRHDAHGNMTEMPHLPFMAWDFQDRLRETRRQVVNHGMPDATCYAYDTAGQRVRKVTLRQDGSRRCERYYVGAFEVFRDYRAGRVERQRTTLHVMDDIRRIALIETETIERGKPAPSPEPALRYRLANHLGSASLELDETGGLLTYEEYSPYGNSTFQAGDHAEVSLKRYRYTGKERDQENGFGYHGARYYAPWLGRWSAADPSGIKNGPNAYEYVNNSPVNVFDPNGKDGFWHNAWEVTKGVGEGAVEFGAGIGHAVAHPIDTVSAIGDKMSQEYHDSGGGVGGVISAVNVVNPAYYAMVAGYETYQAVDRGDYKEAGRQGFNTVAQTVSTVLIATGAAGGISGASSGGVSVTSRLAGAVPIIREGAAVLAPVRVPVIAVSGAVVRSATQLAGGTVMMMAAASGGGPGGGGGGSGTAGGGSSPSKGPASPPKPKDPTTPAKPAAAAASKPLTTGQILARGFPLGFRSFGQFSQFGQALRAGLVRAGFGDVKAIIQGSAATGRSAETGAVFDVGRISDLDVALVGKDLLEAARAAGVDIRGSGLSSGPLTVADIAKLGLTEVRATLTRLAGGRTVNFRIFADEATAKAAGPGIAPR
jgi:RHS repeat-associated protein